MSSGNIVLLASKNAENGSISLHQDIKLYACKNDHANSFEFKVTKGRYIWVQVIKGNLQINDQTLESGDGTAVEDVENIHFHWPHHVEFLIFDLP